MKSRREFLKLSTFAGTALLIAPGTISCNSRNDLIPSWMDDLEDEYLSNPHQAACDWFKIARFGMFIHYGLYSILGRQEWAQFTEKIPVSAYEKLKDQFTAKDFNPDQITDLLLVAGMKYLNVVAKHHDSFCLWDTDLSDFKSTNSPAGRDLIGELSVQCRKKGIALFLTYSYGRDWRHPNAPNRNSYKSYSTRPSYEFPEPAYKQGDEHNLAVYIDYAIKQITELLNNYGNIAGIWIGGTSTILSGPVEPFRLPELYEIIRSHQPQALISNGGGITGTEDVLSPLRKYRSTGDSSKIIEVCDTMQPMGWGYAKDDDGKHKKVGQVTEMLREANKSAYNLLLNTGPLPTGEIHPEDINTLKAVGKYIRKNGFPC